MARRLRQVARPAEVMTVARIDLYNVSKTLTEPAAFGT
jgi:hypothetical protein